MCSLTGNHTMDLMYLLIENFKNLLFDLLIIGRSSKNLSYLSSCSLSQRWRFWRILSNVLREIKSDLAYTKVLRYVSKYILWFGSLWYPARSSTLKNEWLFLLVISKSVSVFSTVQLDPVKNHINYYVTKNNLRSLRGVTKSSKALNVGMFVHSTTLISRFAHLISKTNGFG